MVKDERGNEQYFSSLSDDQKNLILDTELLIYDCHGTEDEIKEWFKTINISGVELTDQELRNAVYSGPFVNAAKKGLLQLQLSDHVEVVEFCTR